MLQYFVTLLMTKWNEGLWANKINNDLIIQNIAKLRVKNLFFAQNKNT
jgi:hypothetical protein